MKRSDFRFIERLRVRWSEVDMQKIVFNGHYLMYFDTAMAGYWRALAMPYEATMQQLQGDLYVRKATLEYLGSARYDDVCEVGMRCARVGNSSITFTAALFRGENLLVHGELIYVFADPATQTSQPVPQALRDLFAAYEAGQTMLELTAAGWAEQGAAVQALRQEATADQQHNPAQRETDAADATALHVLARNRMGRVVATGRLRAAAEGVGQVDRLAVCPPVRGSGIGRAALAGLVDAARQRGDREVLLHAPSSAGAFYRRAGFVARGPVVEEAGMAHQAMVLALDGARALR